METAGERELLEADALLERRDPSRALCAYDAAEQLGANPDACAGGRWLAHMLRGEMEAAWRESDGIRARGAPDPHRFWDGQRLSGCVMVRCLHGYGDTIQMLRYLPDLLAVAARVILEVPPRLFDLLNALPFLRDERLAILTWEQTDAAKAAAWDMQIEVTELPYLFRTQKTDLPIRERYVELPAREVARVAEGMGAQHKPRVGLVWTAGEWNQERALDPSLLRGVLEAPAEFWSLVQRSHLQMVSDAAVRSELQDAEIFGDGILPMAAVIRNLNLMISTDTLAAHLAGAMGVPVWVMLPYAADWRWMADVGTSCWYPSMRLFRQRAPGDWRGVVSEVASALKTLVER